jgi:hypothetical protein
MWVIAALLASGAGLYPLVRDEDESPALTESIA